MNWINLTLLMLGVLTVMFYGIGLIFFGLLLWRIGTEMERSIWRREVIQHAQDVKSVSTTPASEEEEEVDERFKLDEYSDITLENGK